MTGAVVLVTDVVYGTAMTVVVGVLVGLMFSALWYALPLRRRLELGR
jgi:hypothetical protein